MRECLPPRVRVRRDGAVAELDATLLVPGDIVLISEGDRLSADARLLDGAVLAQDHGSRSPIALSRRSVT